MKIKKVEVHFPEGLMSRDFKMEVAALKGKEITPDDLDSMIKLMILRYNFSNISAYFKEGVLSFYPYPKVIIKRILIQGNFRLDKRDILRILPFSTGDEWRGYYTQLIKERIRTLAEKKGLFECRNYIFFNKKRGDLIIKIYEGPPYWIFHIHLDEGNPKFMYLINDMVGKEYSENLVNNEIEKATNVLMKKGYLNPRVELRICKIDHTIKAVTLCSVLAPGYLISVKFTGNKYVSSEELYFMLGLNKKQRLSPGVIDKMKKELKNFYYSHCFPLVNVDVITIIKNNHKEYLFRIREGPHVGISRIIISGVKHFSSRKILSLMVQKPYFSPLHFFLRKCYNPEEFKTDREFIRNFYITNGFINVKVGREKLKYIAGKLIIYLHITEGRQYVFYNLQVTGAHFFSDSYIKKFIRLKKGDPFNPFLVEKACDNLTLLYKNNGFKDASVRYAVSSTNPAFTTLKIIINEGKRYFWGEIFISGNKKVNKRFILEKLGIVPGKPFSQDQYYQIYSNLYETGYFKRVRLSTISYGNRVDLIVDVKEQPSNLIDLSLSLGTQEGVSVDLKFSTWYFLGGIRKLTLYNKTEYDYGSFRELFSHIIPPTYGVLSLLYLEPISPKRNLDFQIFASWERNTKYTEYSYFMRKINFGLNRRFRRRLELTVGINFDSYDFFDVNENTFSGLRRFVLGYLNLVFLRDTRNDIFMPTSGNYQLLSMEYGNKFFLSQFNYFRYKINFAWYKDLWKFNVELVLRAGEVYSSEDPLYLPDVLKFYLGGAYSLRGYASDSIKASRIESEGVKVTMGGISMLDYQLDLNFPLYGNLEWVVFNDGGNVWAENFFAGINPVFKFGAGWGLKYKTPLGPLTFNVGYPLVREEGIAPYQLYFFIKTFL